MKRHSTKLMKNIVKRSLAAVLAVIFIMYTVVPTTIYAYAAEETEVTDTQEQDNAEDAQNSEQVPSIEEQTPIPDAAEDISVNANETETPNEVLESQEGNADEELSDITSDDNQGEVIVCEENESSELSENEIVEELVDEDELMAEITGTNEMTMTFVQAPPQLDVPNATFSYGKLSGLNPASDYGINLNNAEEPLIITADVNGIIDLTAMELSGLIVESIYASGDMINYMDSNEQIINGFIPIFVTVNSCAGVRANSIQSKIIQEGGTFTITLTATYRLTIGNTVVINGNTVASGNSFNGVTYTVINETTATLTGSPNSNTEITGITATRKNQFAPIFSADGTALFIIKQESTLTSNLQSINSVRIKTIDGEYGDRIAMQGTRSNGEALFYLTGLTDAIYVIQPQYADGTVGEVTCIQGHAPVEGSMSWCKDNAGPNAYSIYGPNGMQTSSLRNSAWYLNFNSCNATVLTYTYLSSPNTLKQVSVIKTTANGYCGAAIFMYGRTNFGQSGNMTVFMEDGIVKITDGISTLSIRHGVGDNLYNGWDPVDGDSIPAEICTWWGAERDHTRNWFGNSLNTYVYRNSTVMTNFAWKNAYWTGGGMRVYSLEMTFDEFSNTAEESCIIASKQYAITGENFSIYDGSNTGTLNDMNTKSVVINTAAGYALKGSILIGDQLIESGSTINGVTYEKLSDTQGRITFHKNEMAQETSVEVQTGFINAYTITTSNITIAQEMENGTIYEGTLDITVTPDSFMKLPYSITVGDTEIMVDQTVNGITYSRTSHTSGIITLTADTLEASSSISITALSNVQYSIQTSHVVLDSSQNSGELYDGTLTVTLDAEDGYALPFEIIVGETAVTAGNTDNGVSYVRTDEFNGYIVFTEASMDLLTEVIVDAIKVKNYTIDTYYVVVNDVEESGALIETTMEISLTAQSGKELAESIQINGTTVEEGNETDGVLYERQSPSTATITLQRSTMANDTEIFVSAKLRLQGQLSHSGLMQGTIKLIGLDGEEIGLCAISSDGYYSFYFDPTQSEYLLVTNIMDGLTQRSAITEVSIETIENCVMVNGNTVMLQDGYLISGENAEATEIYAYSTDQQIVNVQNVAFYSNQYVIAGAKNVAYVIASDGNASSYSIVDTTTAGGYISGNADLNTLITGNILTDSNSVIMKENGSIAANATIVLMDATGTTIATTTSNGAGGFILSGVPNGSDYTMVITVETPTVQSYIQECSFNCEGGVATLTVALPDEIMLHSAFNGVVKHGEVTMANVDVYILNSDDEQVGHTVTLPDGSYYLPVTANGNYLAIATIGEGDAEISGTAHLTVSNLHPTNGDIAIIPGHLAYGHIEPALANVEIRVRNAETEELIGRIKTNSDGYFSIGGMQPNTEYLITAAGYGRSGSQYIKTSEEMMGITPDTLIFMETVTMASGLMLGGSVKDSNGMAIAGADVVIRDENGSILTTVTTNQQGNYAYSDFRGGTVYLIASKDSLSGSSTITMTSSGMITTGSKNIVMQEGFVVRGRILGTNHIGLSGVSVTIRQNGQIITTATSTNAGWFWATGLVTGENYEVELVAEGNFGGNSIYEDVCVAEDGNIYPNTFEIESGRTIAGNMQYENGIPVSNAVISLYADGKTLTTTTDAEGNYLVPNLKEGTYEAAVMITISELTMKATGTLVIGTGIENAVVSFTPNELGSTDIENGNTKQTGMLIDGSTVIILNTANITGENNDVAEWMETLYSLDNYQDTDSILNADNTTEVMETILVLADNYFALFPAEQQQLGEENIVRYEALIRIFLESSTYLTVQEYVDNSAAGIEVTEEGLGDIALREITPTQLHAAMEDTTEGNEIRFTLYVTDVTADTDATLEDDREMISNLAGTAYVGSIYNIDVESQIYTAEGEGVAETNVNVTELDALIMIEMEVPSHQQAQYYAIAHVHNGVPVLIPVEVIRGENGETDRIRFYTEKFSTYAIVSSDTLIYNSDGQPMSSVVAGITQGTEASSVPTTAIVETITPTEAAVYADAAELIPTLQEETEPLVVVADSNRGMHEITYHPYIPRQESDVTTVSDISSEQAMSLSIPEAKPGNPSDWYLVMYLEAIIITGILGYVLISNASQKREMEKIMK